VATLRSAVKLEQEQQFLIAKKLQVCCCVCVLLCAACCSALWRLLWGAVSTALANNLTHTPCITHHRTQELTGSKNIKLKPIIDQSLIAGFVVEYGSSQIDLSVR
jgi:hypothetical protein